MVANNVEFNDFNVSDIGKETAGLEHRLVLEKGDSSLRILPPWRKGAVFYKTYLMHFQLGDLKLFGLEMDNWNAEPCISERTIVDDTNVRTVKESCPICRLANKAWGIGQRDKDETLVELAKHIRGKRQYVCNVLDMKDPKEVKTFVYGKKINDALKTIFQLKGNITNPVTGRNVIISKQEVPGQKWPNYAVMVDDVLDISTIWSNISSGLHNLDDLPVYSNYDEINSRLIPVVLDRDAIVSVPVGAPQTGPANHASGSTSGMSSADLDAIFND